MLEKTEYVHRKRRNYFPSIWLFGLRHPMELMQFSINSCNSVQVFSEFQNFKVWWHFFYHLLFLTFSHIIHRTSYIVHSFVLHRLPRPVFLYLHRFSAQQEKSPRGAEPRIELGHALQQSDELRTEPRRTLKFCAIYSFFLSCQCIKDIMSLWLFVQCNAYQLNILRTPYYRK